jgi:hypothetical protein
MASSADVNAPTSTAHRWRSNEAAHPATRITEVFTRHNCAPALIERVGCRACHPPHRARLGVTTIEDAIAAARFGSAPPYPEHLGYPRCALRRQQPLQESKESRHLCVERREEPQERRRLVGVQ